MNNEIKGPPGVGIRRGSPVVHERGATRSTGVVCDVYTGDADVHFDVFCEGLHADDVMAPLCEVSLDLTDPTGFMHGVWALAERYGTPAPTDARLEIEWLEDAGPHVTLQLGPESWDAWIEFSLSTCPGLSEIDPKDPQRDARVLACLLEAE